MIDSNSAVKYQKRFASVCESAIPFKQEFHVAGDTSSNWSTKSEFPLWISDFFKPLTRSYVPPEKWAESKGAGNQFDINFITHKCSGFEQSSEANE